ncbi:MAG: VWA domain-containing protein [Planctomycetota bacterium]
MTTFRFAEPWAVLALSLLVLWLAVSLWRRPKAPAVLAPVYRRAEAAGSSPLGLLAWLPTIARVSALVLIVYALARPQELRQNAENSQDAIALQLVVDRSGSMNDPADFEGQSTNRLEAVKQVVRRFVLGDDSGANPELQGRAGDLIGLIVFGSFADTLMPLTSSHEALVESLEQVQVARDRRERSTAIGDALVLANARLRATEDILRSDSNDPDFALNSKAIVLLTDGENRDGQYSPADAAGLAKEWGVRIYIVGIRGGTRIGAGSFGRGVQPVNEREMRAVAEHTGGRFWPVDNLSDLPDIYAQIDRLERTEIRVSETTEITELYHQPARAGVALLAIEALLRALLFRRLHA